MFIQKLNFSTKSSLKFSEKTFLLRCLSLIWLVIVIIYSSSGNKWIKLQVHDTHGGCRLVITRLSSGFLPSATSRSVIFWLTSAGIWDTVALYVTSVNHVTVIVSFSQVINGDETVAILQSKIMYAVLYVHSILPISPMQKYFPQSHKKRMQKLKKRCSWRY